MRKTKRSVVVGAVLVFLTTAGLAAGQASKATQEEQVERGRKQYQQACGFCHGADATGARGPDLVRSALVAHDVNGNLIGDVIRNGRPEKGMPPLSETAEQIADISAFLHARAKEAIESSGVPAAYPAERLLTGNAEKGKALFEGTGGCKNCHSTTGDLAGVARKYSSIELEAHLLYPDDAPVSAVITLASGEQIGGIISHLDDFVVSIRVGGKSGWYRSFARDKVKVELKDPLAAHRELLAKLTSADMHNLFAFLNNLK